MERNEMILGLHNLVELVKEGEIADEYLGKVLDAFRRYVNGNISLEELYNSVSFVFATSRLMTPDKSDKIKTTEKDLKEEIKNVLLEISDMEENQDKK
jgi:hypothetical protein